MKLKPFEPDITNVNGVWAVTEKGAAAGITLDDVIGKSGRMATASTGQEQNRYILDAFFGKDEQNTSRPSWLTDLFEQLQQR